MPRPSALGTRRSALAAGVLLLGGCGEEKITAPEVLAFVARWDSTRIKFAEDGLALTWAPVNGWENMPAPGAIPVALDDRSVLYHAVVVEHRMINSRYDAHGCGPNNHVTLLLWREASSEPALDVIVASIGAAASTMEGALLPGAYSWDCGLTRSATALAYLNHHWLAGSTRTRPAVAGRFRAKRIGTPRPCNFLASPEDLVSEGVSCEMQRFDIDLDAVLRLDTDGLGIAGGATEVRVSRRSLPGATFTVDCAATAWSRGICG